MEIVNKKAFLERHYKKWESNNKEVVEQFVEWLNDIKNYRENNYLTLIVSMDKKDEAKIYLKDGTLYNFIDWLKWNNWRVEIYNREDLKYTLILQQE